uniref:Protein quiver n=1 Tax=Plectus sambesii TaxID=2011161 RepID=A0A914WI25_9BILA
MKPRYVDFSLNYSPNVQVLRRKQQEESIPSVVIWMKISLPLIIGIDLCVTFVMGKGKCFSCASTNMQHNFLTKQRGPQVRIAEPLIFDNFCNKDTWILKKKALVECDGQCFKWQQIVNNSGDFSLMTLRSCYGRMFDKNNPATRPEPDHGLCETKETQLSCLADAELIESVCWCDDDECNSTSRLIHSRLIICLLSAIILIAYTAAIQR